MAAGPADDGDHAGPRRAAERDKEVILIDAERDARANQVEKVVAAETEVESQLKLADMEKQRAVIDAEGQLAAEEQLAEKIRVAATGRAKAMEQDQLAMVREADGQKALLAKEGLAEAEVARGRRIRSASFALSLTCIRTGVTRSMSLSVPRPGRSMPWRLPVTGDCFATVLIISIKSGRN